MRTARREVARGAAALLVLVTCGRTSAADAAGTLISPAAEDVVLLYFALRGIEPPLEAWGRSDPAITTADEFHRPAAVAAHDRRISQSSRA